MSGGVPSWAVKGAKVVHEIDPALVMGRRTVGANYPEVGGIYTVRDVVARSGDGQPLFLLREIRNAPEKFGCRLEPGFDIRHFRPLVTRSQEQDIAEHFAGYLTHRAPERADA